MEKVSVIVPIYNVESYLEKCIVSLVTQSYTNIEIILVNDGSTDSCKKICKKWLELDSRIIYIEKENGGLSSARNAGLEIVNGDYLLFVDSDDYIEKDAISYLIEKNDNEYDWIVFNYKEVYADSSKNIYSKFQNGIFMLNSEKNKLLYLLKNFFQRKHGWEAWNRLYKVRLLKQYNLRFYDNKVIFAEDLDFNLRYLYYCNQIKVINNSLYNYIIRDDSIMGCNKNNNKLNQFMNLSKHIYNFYKEQNAIIYLENFYLIHFGIIKSELQRIYHNNPSKIKEYTSAINDKAYYNTYINLLITHLYQVYSYYGLKNVVLIVLTKFQKYKL